MGKKLKINKTKREIMQNWVTNHGAATFDLENRNIILHDGSLFSIEKEIKIKPKTRLVFGKLKEYVLNGKKHKSQDVKFITIKRKGRIIKEKVEYYRAYLWFEELNELISYFESMKKMLNKLGYKTKKD